VAGAAVVVGDVLLKEKLQLDRSMPEMICPFLKRFYSFF
jgi:hypothetical protein